LNAEQGGSSRRSAVLAARAARCYAASVAQGSITPILRIFDEHKAREFYEEFLGFEIDWQHRFEPNAPLYQSVSRQGCTLHLSEHHGDACPGTAVRIEWHALDDLHRELTAQRYKYYRPSIEAMPWGSREMTVKDPFGNRLTFFVDAPEVRDPEFGVEAASK
jgi:uncharacterized glyoxalase superfamily protein PhnB